jgi:hypothetical protein
MKHHLIHPQRPVLAFVCLLAIALFCQAAYADDLDGFTLNGVIMQTKDGREISAYVRWSPALFQEGARFPGCLLDRKTWQDFYVGDSLLLYTEVYPVAPGLGFEGRFLVTTAAQRIELPLAQVARITAIRRPYDGYGETGEVPTVHSPTALRWLTSEKPQAFAEDYDDLFGKLISYNRAISQSELQQLLKQMKQWEAQTRKQLERVQSEAESARIRRKAEADRDRLLARKRVVWLPIFMGC